MICKLTPELWDRPGAGGQLGETGQKALQTARVRAVRTVAIALASRSPRCFGGRVARRRLATLHKCSSAMRNYAATEVWHGFPFNGAWCILKVQPKKSAL